MTDQVTTPDLSTYGKLSQRGRDKLLKAPELATAIQELSKALASAASGSRPISFALILSDLNRLARFRKADLESEDVVKLILRALMEAGGKQRTRSLAVRRQGSLLMAASDGSKTFCKVFKQFAKKADFGSFNNLMDFVSTTNNKEVLAAVAERAKEEGGRLDIHKRPWNPQLFAALARAGALKDFMCQVRDCLRRNIASLPALAEVFAGLNLALIDDHTPFEETFDVVFNDAFGKGDGPTLALLSLASSLLSGNKALTARSRSESFVNMLNQRLAKSESQDILAAHAWLIAGLNFAFEPRVQNDTVLSLVDGLGALKSPVEVNKVLDRLRLNKSLPAALPVTYLLDRKKGVAEPTLTYALASLAADPSAYNQFLSDFQSQNAKQKLGFTNYKNYLFALAIKAKAGELDGSLQQEFIRRVTSKDEYFAKAGFFEGSLRPEAEAVLVVAAAVTDESISKADLTPANRHAYGAFLVAALNAYFQSWSKLTLKFGKKTLKIIVRSLAIMLWGEPRAKFRGENYARVLRWVLLTNQLMCKSPVILHKTLLLVSTDGLFDSADIRLIAKSPLFQAHAGTELPEAFYRLLSRHNLFGDSDHKTWRNMLIHCMYFSPTMLQQSMYFFAKRNLVHLLNMSLLLREVEGIKPLPLSFFFERDEWELAGIKEKGAPAGKGKAKAPPKEETLDDVTFVMTAADFDSDPGLNEDERLDELQLSNSKGPLLASFEHLLRRLSEAYLLFFGLYPRLMTPRHLEVVERQLHIFKDSFRTVDHFSALLNTLYGCFLRNSSRNSAPEFKQLLEFNAGIIRGNDSPQFVRSLEFYLRTADLTRIHVTRDVFEILFDVLGFVFDNKIDTEYKRKLFSFVYKSLAGYPDMERPFFDFMCKNFDELHFEEAFESFRGLLVRLSPTQADLVDRGLDRILDYEEFVVCFMLKSLRELAAAGSLDNQKVTVLQQLKVLILSEGEEPKTSQPAKALIEASPLFRFGAASFDSLDFHAIIRDFPTDLHETIASILTKVYESLDAQQKILFIKTLFAQTRDLVLNTKHADEEAAKEAETRYQLFSKTLFHLTDKLDEEFIFAAFAYIFGELTRHRAAAPGPALQRTDRLGAASHPQAAGADRKAGQGLRGPAGRRHPPHQPHHLHRRGRAGGRPGQASLPQPVPDPPGPPQGQLA
jgi:hypothetical protein